MLVLTKQPIKDLQKIIDLATEEEKANLIIADVKNIWLDLENPDSSDFVRIMSALKDGSYTKVRADLAVFANDEANDLQDEYIGPCHLFMKDKNGTYDLWY